MSDTKKSRKRSTAVAQPVTPKEFDNSIETLKNSYRAISDCKKRFGETPDLQKGGSLMHDNKEVTTASIRAADRAMLDKLDDVKRMYFDLFKSKKRNPYKTDEEGNVLYEVVNGEKRPVKRDHKSKGFKKPTLMSTDMRRFFAEGNFGLVNPDDPHSGRLMDALTNLRGDNPNFPGLSVTLPGILTSIFCIYTLLNDLPSKSATNRGKHQTDWNRGRLGCDDLMKACFGKSFEILSAQPPRKDKKGDIRRTAIDDFYYADFQRLASLTRRNMDGRIKKFGIPTPAGPPLTEAEIKLLADPALVEELRIEQGIVSQALSALQRRREEGKAILSAEPRHEAPAPKPAAAATPKKPAAAPLARKK